MRAGRWGAVAVSAAAAALGGCGDESRPALTDALSYMPADAALVLVLPSDLDAVQLRNFDAKLARPLLGAPVRALVRETVEGAGLSFEDDVEPLLGNPVVLGFEDLADPAPGAVVALRVADAGALAGMPRRAGLRAAGRAAGARLYRGDGAPHVAVDGEVLLAAGSERSLRRALGRPGRPGRLTHAAFSRALEGMSGGAVLRGYGWVPSLLRDARAQRLRGQPWLRSLRTFAFALSVRVREVELEAQLRGSPQGLTDADLPVAPGERPARVLARPRDFTIGLRDAGRSVAFVREVARAVAPGSPEAKSPIYGRLRRVIAGPVLAAYGADGEKAVRMPVRDRAGARALARSAPGAIRTVGAQLVVATSERAAREVAEAPAVELEDTRGAMVFRADLSISDFGLGLGLGPAPLGEMVGWVEASRERTRVRARVELRR